MKPIYYSLSLILLLGPTLSSSLGSVIFSGVDGRVASISDVNTAPIPGVTEKRPVSPADGMTSDVVKNPGAAGDVLSTSDLAYSAAYSAIGIGPGFSTVIVGAGQAGINAQSLSDSPIADSVFLKTFDLMTSYDYDLSGAKLTLDIDHNIVDVVPVADPIADGLSGMGSDAELMLVRGAVGLSGVSPDTSSINPTDILYRKYDFANGFVGSGESPLATRSGTLAAGTYTVLAYGSGSPVMAGPHAGEYGFQLNLTRVVPEPGYAFSLFGCLVALGFRRRVKARV